MFKRLEETLGEEHATVLMEHVAPAGWADVATKRDLEQLEARLVTRFDSRFDAVDSRFETMEPRIEAKLEAALHAQTRTMVQWFLFGTMAAVLAVGSLAFAAARFV